MDKDAKVKWEAAIDVLKNSNLRESYFNELNNALLNSSMNDVEKANILSSALASCYQIDSEMAFRIAFQTDILAIQARTAEQQMPFEVNGSENQALKLKAEAQLAVNNSELISAQRKTEVLRRKDLESSIQVKNQQAIASYISAKSEETKRKILIQSSYDNVQIKRAEYNLQYLKILSDDNEASISEPELHKRIKGAVDKIGVGSDYSYKEITNIPRPIAVNPSDDGFDISEPAINILIIPREPKVNEIVRFLAVSSNIDRTLNFTWYVSNIAESGIISNDFTGHFSSSGYKNISLLISENDTNKAWTYETRIYVSAAN